MLCNIWIDADSCPRMVRRYVLKKATALRVAVIFVANHVIPVETEETSDRNPHFDPFDRLRDRNAPHFSMIVCDKAQDAADDVIVQRAGAFDLVVTRDVPLAARLVDKGVCVMNDRGTLFNKDNIKDKLFDRNFDLQLAHIGFGGQSAPSYSNKELRAFAERFDCEVTRLVRDAAANLYAASSSG